MDEEAKPLTREGYQKLYEAFCAGDDWVGMRVIEIEDFRDETGQYVRVTRTWRGHEMKPILYKVESEARP